MTTHGHAFFPTLVLALLLAPAGAAGDPAPLAPPSAPVAVPMARDLTGLVDLDEVASRTSSHLPHDGAGIGPGALLLISMPGGAFSCTANFLWRDQADRLYLGSAGHCFLPASKKATHGPGADYDPALTTVRVCILNCSLEHAAPAFRGSLWYQLGPLAYARQTGPGGDVGNDFGLVVVPPGAAPALRPEMPLFQGPTSSGGLRTGGLLCHYGHGTAWGEAVATRGRMGVGVLPGGPGGSWSGLLAIAAGDSGSAIQGCVATGGGFRGSQAVGIITHSVLVPVVGLGLGYGTGTTMEKARDMAAQAGLVIQPVLAPA